MKLISCYVENFGNISERNYNFENLSALCERNGFGKTTLAAFIKAMFYGLPATRANSNKGDDRQRYYPFDGGKFGGNITFKKGGDEYRVERFFGKKSATGDECRVYENGALTECPDGAGKEIFGLDEGSFMRTVFVNSQETEVGATSSINAKLNNFVDATDEHNNYDSAMDILVRTKKSYRADRGAGGKISAVKERIASLKSEIRNAEQIEESLGAKYSEREEVAKRIAELDERLNRARENNLVLQRWETYSSYLADAEREKAALSELERKYPAGLPARMEIDGLSAAARAKESAADKIETISFPTEKKRRLEELTRKFRDGTPTEAELKGALEKAAEISAERGEVKFPAGVPKEEEVEKCSQSISKLRELRSEQSAIAPRKKKSKLALIFAAVGAALIVAGVAMLFVQMTAAVILLVAGLLSAGGFVYLKVAGGQAVQPENQSEINNLESAAASFLVKYGYYTGGGVEVDFNNLLRDLKEHELSREKAERRRILRGELENFLSSFGENGGDFQEGVLNLKAAVSEYLRLSEEAELVHKTESGLRAGYEESGAEISEILKKYRIPESGNLSTLVKTIDADRREYDRLISSVRALGQKAQTVKSEYNLTKKPEGEPLDTAYLAEQLSALRTKRSDIDRNIDADEDAVERLQSKRNDLEIEKENLAEYQKRYDLLTKTIEALENAETNLKDKYVSPVRNRFLQYSEALEEALGEKVVMDADFKVKFERGGELRGDLHLSAGQKSLCALCIRLALIDNMYGGEAPFVIMDDPFVHLDAEHMARAAKLIKKLSENMQIIYFCCHESRMI